MTKHKKIASLILAASVASNSLLNNASIPRCAKVAAVKVTFSNRQKFTPEEDAKIIDFVKHHGEGNWAKCAELLPERNARSIECRWKNSLKLVDNSPLTYKEKDTLAKAVAIEGKHWATISKKYFENNRTSVKLKNAYRSIQKFENLKSSNPAIVESSLDTMEDPLIDLGSYLFGVQNLDTSNPLNLDHLSDVIVEDKENLLDMSYPLSTENLLDPYNFSDVVVDDTENLPNTVYFSDIQNSETKKIETTKPKRKKFTLKEDEIIRGFVQKHGTSNWKECLKLLPNRDLVSIRKRWANNLNPKIKDNYYLNPEEVETLLEAYEVCGPEWTYINKEYFENKKSPQTLMNKYNQIVNQRKKSNLAGDI